MPAPTRVEPIGRRSLGPTWDNPLHELLAARKATSTAAPIVSVTVLPLEAGVTHTVWTLGTHVRAGRALAERDACWLEEAVAPPAAHPPSSRTKPTVPAAEIAR